MSSKQPWSTYAVQLTTLSPPALIGDLMLWGFLVWGTQGWALNERWNAFYALGAWMIFSKFIKLVTHFVRYPVDILLWPVSVLFGWYHGIIKWHALATLYEVGTPDSRVACHPDNCRQLGVRVLEPMLLTRSEWSDNTRNHSYGQYGATRKITRRRLLLLTTSRKSKLLQLECLLAWRLGQD